MSRRGIFLALGLAQALFLSPTTTLAAEKRMRLTIEVKIEGTEGVVGTGRGFRSRGSTRT